MNQKRNGLNFKSFWLPLFLFAAACICFYKALDKLPDVLGAVSTVLSILTPFIIGIIIAFLLYKPAFKLEEQLLKIKWRVVQKHSRGFSVLICYAVFLVIIATVLYLIIPRIISSLVNLVNNIPSYYEWCMNYLKTIAGTDGKILGFEISGIQKNINLSTILSFFDFGTLTKYATEIFKATSAVVDLSMAFVVSVYMLLGREHLIKVCGKLFCMVLPRRRVQKLYYYISRSCEIFYNYLYSQLIDAVIVTVLCFVVFSIARLPYALLLALLMGICNLIPYFGAIIGGFGVVFVTLVSTGKLVSAVIALICVVGSQQLDANVLQPRIVSNSVGIRPIYVLLAITICGGLFGFVGILFGVPLFAVIRMLILDYMENLGDEETPIVKKQQAHLSQKDSSDDISETESN